MPRVGAQGHSTMYLPTDWVHAPCINFIYRKFTLCAGIPVVRIASNDPCNHVVRVVDCEEQKSILTEVQFDICSWFRKTGAIQENFNGSVGVAEMSSTQMQPGSVSDLLTLIITTSVTPSIPSTDLLTTIFDTFYRHCPHLFGCRVIVVFDNYDQITSQARLKKGQVTQQQAQHWDNYKISAKKLIVDHFDGTAAETTFSKEECIAEYGSPKITNRVAFTATKSSHERIIFIEPQRRIGFGLAVRSALRMTTTPYVWVQQHDWSLEADIPIGDILQVMLNSDASPEAEMPIKYICLPGIRMLSYATSADVTEYPALKELTAKLKHDIAPPQYPERKVPLTPLFFWHDKPHIASTKHYLARVFPSALAMLRGDFIEDKIGQRARTQMKDGLWSKWATWLYYPDDGQQLCLRHLQGRIFQGTEARTKQIAFYQEQNLKRSMEMKVSRVKSPDALDGDNEDVIGDFLT